MDEHGPVPDLTVREEAGPNEGKTVSEALDAPPPAAGASYGDYARMLCAYGFFNAPPVLAVKLARHPALRCPDFPLRVISISGEGFPAPWDQRTRSDDQAPKLRRSNVGRAAPVASATGER